MSFLIFYPSHEVSVCWSRGNDHSRSHGLIDILGPPLSTLNFPLRASATSEHDFVPTINATLPMRSYCEYI